MMPNRLMLLMSFAACLTAGPTATLTGRVTDPSGGVIPGVKVEATHVETNVTFPSETNGEGLYNIPNLPPGTYRIIVQKFAFQTIVKPDVELHVQDVIALNFSMEVGSIVQSVTAEGGAPLIQATPARGGDFLSSEVRNLPLVALNPISPVWNSCTFSSLPVDVDVTNESNARACNSMCKWPTLNRYSLECKRKLSGICGGQ